MNKKTYLTAEQIEKRFSVIRTLISVAVALVFCFIMIALSSENLANDVITFITAPVSSLSRFTTFIIKMCPIIFTSCAICLLFQSGVSNLAVEGAFYVAAVMAAAVGAAQGMPPVIHFVIMALTGAVSAAAVLLIPAILQVKFNANIVVSSLMLNYVCTFFANYLVTGPFRDPGAGYEATYLVADSAKLAKVSLGGGQFHVGIFIALAAVALTWFILFKTTFGYQCRTVGANSRFAHFSGIKVAKVILLSSIVAGFLTGIGGATEVSGYYARLNWVASPQYGWDGIMVATLARNNPIGALAASAFLAYIRTSADVLNITSVVPVEIVEIAQQVIIVMIAARGLLYSFEKKAIVKNARKQMESMENHEEVEG